MTSPAFNRLLPPLALLLLAGALAAHAASSATNLAVVRFSDDGRRITFAVELAYDGAAGPNARLVPAIEDISQRAASAWFGSEPVTVQAGRARYEFAARYFNEEPGVPAQTTTEWVRLYLFDDAGAQLLGEFPFVQPVRWGAPGQKSGRQPDASEDETQRQKRIIAQAARAGAEARWDAKQAAETLQRAREKAALAYSFELKARAAAETATRDLAQATSPEETARLQTQQRQAEDKAAVLTEARQSAEAAARAAAEAQTRAADERWVANQIVQAHTARLAGKSEAVYAPPPLATHLKSRISNIDVVFRSMDRSQMTLGVEYKYLDPLAKPVLTLDILRSTEPETRQWFVTKPQPVGGTRRNYALFPVTFQPAHPDTSSLTTDQVLVSLAEEGQAPAGCLFPAAILLSWSRPGAGGQRPSAPAPAGPLVIEDFVQRDLASGQLVVRYQLASGSGQISAKLYDRAKPESAQWFDIEPADITGAQGRAALEVAVSDKSIPANLFATDTLEVSLRDGRQGPVTTQKRDIRAYWSRPK